MQIYKKDFEMPEIMTLFSIYPAKKTKRVWLDHLVPQGEYLYTLNRFFAWYLFDIKRPDAYLKAMETSAKNVLLILQIALFSPALWSQCLALLPSENENLLWQ